MSELHLNFNPRWLISLDKMIIIKEWQKVTQQYNLKMNQVKNIISSLYSVVSTAVISSKYMSEI